MKRIIRNVIIAFLTAAMFVSFFSCGSFAAEEDRKLIYPTGDGFTSTGFERDIKLKGEDEASLVSESACEVYMAQQCILRKDEIDIHGYNIPLEVSESFWYNFIMNHPELPLETHFSYDYYPDETIICSIYPTYLTDSFEEDEQIRKTLEEGIDELISRAANCDDPLGKLLIIHDEIIKDCEYDLDYLPIGYNAYGFFVNHRMVCQGYTQLFGAICKRLGIESGFCRSDEKEHVWNYVCINGKWYHVDITWDDPVIFINGNVIEHTTTARHRGFLMSDERAENDEIGNTNHGEKSTWTSSLGFVPDCDDTFESKHIFNLPDDSTIVYDGEKYIFRYDSVTYTSPAVYTGEIITSELTKSNTDISQYYYCFDDIDTNVNFIVLTKSSSGGFLTLTQKNEGKKENGRKYTATFSARRVPKNAEISFMYWKEGTMTPLTAKKSIINK